MNKRALTTIEIAALARSVAPVPEVPFRLNVVSVLEATEDVLDRCGVESGMHVLDLGCGVGDTSLLIAKLVGPTGLVVGVDASAQAIERAERRATAAMQCYWVRFVVADLNTFVPDQQFDAVVVRLALKLRGQHAFAGLSTCVRTGGVIVVVAREDD
jgi:ubiquinone/menaquinone biosynthesis C-methylase UbiE